MIERTTHVSGLGAIVAAGVLLAACSSGPGGAEFMEACLQEGQNQASQMLDRELGVTREAFCACGEPIARSSLSNDGYRAMVLEMQGRGQEAREITSAMNDAEQMAVMKTMSTLMLQCAGAEQN